MTANKDSRMILSFGWRSMHTDHKVNAIIDCLAKVDARNAGLDIQAVGYDDDIIDNAELEKRITHLIAISNKLIRRGVSVDVILPGLKTMQADDRDYLLYIKNLYKKAAQIRAHRIWVDDRAMELNGSARSGAMLNFYRNISKIVRKEKPKMSIGLIATDPQHYIQADINVFDAARALAGNKTPVLAFESNFITDRDRCSILDAALHTAVNIALADDIELVAILENYYASGYVKSVEATQMQNNINQIMGIQDMHLDCFDLAGTASESENLYLQMHNHFLKQNQALEKYFDAPASNLINQGLQIIIAEDGSVDTVDGWAQMFWRMGLPVSFVSANKLSKDNIGPWPFVLAGRGPILLDKPQLDIVFNNGVIMDCYTAELLQAQGYSAMLGTDIVGPLADVQNEILSYQGFAAPYFSFQTAWMNIMESEHWRRLNPTDNNCEIITTLATKNCKSTTPGAVKFDNVKKCQRSIILPFAINKDNYFPLLNAARQRHFRDMLSWLIRGKLPLAIENTPDLVPFVVAQPACDKMILALLNISFDWALDAKIKLGKLPFKVKKIKELDEHGRVKSSPQLQIKSYLDHQYIKLDNDSAIPPMQMLILLMEG